ncbi:hypothetical protein E4T44_00389 [Aureobasidium sp. EXF-8845]|nr:hypothetical protein E4T44_00389 [Aureobasidium sp. EXF-8845]KAI4857150.1 hypothetical protein E4T45_01363 [Aureobasidium sp. EXF-8846]
MHSPIKLSKPSLAPSVQEPSEETSHQAVAKNSGTTGRRRACFACIEARAKCSREGPCRRCSIRGIACIYPDAARRSTRSSTRLNDQAFEPSVTQHAGIAGIGHLSEGHQDIPSLT